MSRSNCVGSTRVENVRDFPHWSIHFVVKFADFQRLGLVPDSVFQIEQVVLNQIIECGKKIKDLALRITNGEDGKCSHPDAPPPLLELCFDFGLVAVGCNRMCQLNEW